MSTASVDTSSAVSDRGTTGSNDLSSRPRRTITPDQGDRAARIREARRQVFYELISGASGLALALFMWGHMLFVATILTGESGFNWLAKGLEDVYIAQPTVVAITTLFLVHAAMASRKIPAQLRERKRLQAMARGLRANVSSAATANAFRPHVESWLWIWQVRTGMLILVAGSFHLVLVGIDVLTPLFGERVGIEAASSMARVGSGLWIVYGILLVCVEFHAGVGLYRLAVKWGAGSRLSRSTLHRLEQVIFWMFLGLGFVTLFVLAGWVEPPLAFLLER